MGRSSIAPGRCQRTSGRYRGSPSLRKDPRSKKEANQPRPRGWRLAGVPQWLRRAQTTITRCVGRGGSRTQGFNWATCLAAARSPVRARSVARPSQMGFPCQVAKLQSAARTPSPPQRLAAPAASQRPSLPLRNQPLPSFGRSCSRPSPFAALPWAVTLRPGWGSQSAVPNLGRRATHRLKLQSGRCARPRRRHPAQHGRPRPSRTRRSQRPTLANPGPTLCVLGAALGDPRAPLGPSIYGSLGLGVLGSFSSSL